MIVKHNNPCGVAIGGDALDAYEKALACDPMSAFGGVIAINRPISWPLADLIHQNFVEVPCEVGTGMCVSATGITDTKASYSNYGVSAIHVAAPGGDVDAFVLSPCSSRSVLPQLAACKSRVRYLFVIGTSQATPHVSGLAALLDSQYGGALNPAQLQSNLEQCSDDNGKPGADPFYGKGRINAFKTVNQVGCNNGSP